MKVAIIAAGGQIARLVTERLLTEDRFADIEVTLALRQPDQLKHLADHPRVTLVKADLTDLPSVASVVAGQDLVFVAVVDHDAQNVPTRNVIAAMQAQQVDRIIYTNILGIYDEVPGEFGRWNLSMVAPGLAAAKKSDQLLAASGLNYTTLRLPWLNDRDEIKYVVTHQDEPYIGVSGSRKSVADLVLKLMTTPDMGNFDSLGLADPATAGSDRPVY